MRGKYFERLWEIAGFEETEDTSNYETGEPLDDLEVRELIISLHYQDRIREFFSDEYPEEDPLRYLIGEPLYEQLFSTEYQIGSIQEDEHPDWISDRESRDQWYP